MALALYRTYRPGSLNEVIGQEHVTEPLARALGAGRVHHAYLFSGPRGCGKTSTARILARSLNCETGPTATPCGTCRSCVELAPNGPGSIDVVELDAATHRGIDDARDLREKAIYAPAASRYKIYIIDEAHQLTNEAANALLKLVEEPPPHLRFIFATTEPDKIIPTIRSRTFHYGFRLVPAGVLADHLAGVCRSEGVPAEPAALGVVARAGAGSVRDSLSVLGQLLAGAGPAGLTYADSVAALGMTDASLIDAFVDALAAGSAAQMFVVVEGVISAGHDPRRFVTDVLERLRDLIILKADPRALESGLIDVPDYAGARMVAQAQSLGLAELSRAADLVSAGLSEVKGATAPRLQLELLCARLALTGRSADVTDLVARLERLERGAPQAGDRVGVPRSERGQGDPGTPRPSAPVSVGQDPAESAAAGGAPAARVPAAGHPDADSGIGEIRPGTPSGTLPQHAAASEPPVPATTGALERASAPGSPGPPSAASGTSARARSAPPRRPQLRSSAVSPTPGGASGAPAAGAGAPAPGGTQPAPVGASDSSASPGTGPHVDPGSGSAGPPIAAIPGGQASPPATETLAAEPAGPADPQAAPESSTGPEPRTELAGAPGHDRSVVPERPAGHDRAVVPGSPAGTRPGQESPAAPERPAGPSLSVVTGQWPAVLDRLSSDSRVAWTAFHGASPISLANGVLAVAVTEPGHVRAIAQRGHDERLRQALIDVLSLDVSIDVIHDPDAARRAHAAADDPAATPGPPTGSQSPGDPFGPSAPSAIRPAASEPRAAADAVGASSPAGSAATESAPSRPAAAGQGASQVRRAAATRSVPEDAVPDEPSADDPDFGSSADGLALITRELGARPIGEIDHT